MDNFKKKLSIILESFLYTLLNHFRVILFAFVIMLLFGSISFASEEETDLLLDRFFDYCDNYYNMDFSNNTDIHSIEFQNYLSFIHYNNQQIKAKIYAFKNGSTENLEKYSKFNCIDIQSWHGSFRISFYYIPNNNNYNNYGYSEYRGELNQSVANYNFPFAERVVLDVDGNGNIGNVRLPSLQTGYSIFTSYQIWNYAMPMNYSLIFYKDNNYYSSVPNFNGNASYFINNSNARVNGLSDYGFFNINYNDVQTIDVDEDIVFGDLYVGYNYSINNQVVYLYNETTSQILDNEIDLVSIGGLYNGRYHYQVVSEDLNGLNEDYQYRLICSSSSPILASFVSKPFKFSFKNEQPGQLLPSIIILSGDYQGVGSGDGFNKAINDINNNIGVLGNKADKINNNIKNIVNYISDSTSPDSTLNEFFSGDYEDFATKMGYSTIPNNYYDYLKTTFESIINALNVPIPDYQPWYDGPTVTFELFNNSFTISTWDLNPFWIGFKFSDTPNGEVEEQHWQSLRIIISVFTNGFICYFIIKRFASWIVKLQTLDFNVVNKVDTDINLF